MVALHAKGLVERGHAVHVVWQKQRTPKRLLHRWRRTLGLGSSRQQGSTYFDGSGVTQSIAASEHITAEDLPDADVVIATWWETAFFAAALPACKGRQFYFVQHHEVHGHLPSHISRATYYLPLKKVTISSWLADIMAEEYGDHDVSIVKNSIDREQFDAPPRVKNPELTIGFMYSFKKFKGTDIAIEAIKEARKRVPDLRVLAFGIREPSGGRFELPKDTEYFRAPPQADIPAIYAKCDLWLCSSWEEGFGLPILEAMACRCPVISTRVGGAVDLIEPGINGWLADPGDVASLANHIADAATLSPDAWEKMSNAAYSSAHSYTWDDATDALDAIISRSANT